MQNWLQNGAILSSEGGDFVLGEGPFVSRSFNDAGEGFFKGGFFDGADEVLKPELLAFVPEKALRELLVNFEGLPGKLTWEEPELDSFVEVFKDIQNRISTGALEKVVPVVFESAALEVTPEILGIWLMRGLSSTTRGHLFGHWDLQAGQGVLGLTPETLFTQQGNRLSTMALAGTARSDEHRLLEDPKEVKEHELVVQSLKNTLSEFGSVKLTDPYEWSPGALTHLRTDLSVGFNSDEWNPLKLIQKLHPTPALGGVPQKESLAWLEANEGPVRRGVFGAPFGFVSKHHSKVIVSIRCLIWRDGKVFVGSGCGIVRESQLENEWQELKNKRRAVKKVFGWD